MNEQVPCCEHSKQERNFASPFTRALVLGYYDGPTEGLTECSRCGKVYKFDLLAWDPAGQDLRVFALAPLPSTALRRLIEANARYEKPRWPLWVPLWQFPSDEDREAMKRLTEQVLREAGPAEWVIATYDLLGQIASSKKSTVAELSQTTDWSSFLGLGTEAPGLVPMRISEVLGEEP